MLWFTPLLRTKPDGLAVGSAARSCSNVRMPLRSGVAGKTKSVVEAPAAVVGLARIRSMSAYRLHGPEGAAPEPGRRKGSGMLPKAVVLLAPRNAMTKLLAGPLAPV